MKYIEITKFGFRVAKTASRCDFSLMMAGFQIFQLRESITITTRRYTTGITLEQGSMRMAMDIRTWLLGCRSIPASMFLILIIFNMPLCMVVTIGYLELFTPSSPGCSRGNGITARPSRIRHLANLGRKCLFTLKNRDGFKLSKAGKISVNIKPYRKTRMKSLIIRYLQRIREL